MEAFVLVLIAALILEALLQVVKSWVPEGTKTPAWLWPVAGAVLGVALCLLGGVDLLAQTGLALSVPVAGNVLTGILISRGASFVHDLWGRIKDGGMNVSTILNGIEVEEIEVEEEETAE